MKMILITVFYIILTTQSFSQFRSIYKAEDYVIGSWIPIASSQNSNSLITITIDPDQYGKTLEFYSDHTIRQVLGKAYKNKIIEGVWEVEKNQYGEYNIKAQMGNGWLKTIERYYFDGYDYLIDDFGNKYRK